MEPLHSISSVVFLLLPLLTLSLFLELFSVVNCKALEQCLQKESSTLLQLKRGFIYAELDTWQPGTDCCFWLGVTCDESSRVAGLDLSEQSIFGKIDPILFNLTSLETLNLSYNDFYNQSIPDLGWERLANLSILNLSSSGFTGKVPAGIYHLTKMTSLDLSNNLDLSFTANLTFLQNMSNLREFHLDSMNLSAYGGEWYGALANYTPALAALSMQGCSLFGSFPNQIFHLRNLKYLDISYNQMFYGSLPEFPEHSNLEILIIYSTNFSGNLPDTMGNLKFLTFLILGGCQFSGRIPTFICNLINLEILYLSDNKLTGYIPQCLLERNSLKVLTYLDLSKNKLTGEIPTFICNLTNLEILDLSDNKLIGSIPSCLFEEESSLRMQNLRGNQLHEAIPHGVTPFCKMETINLRENQLEGLLPRFLSKCHSLKLLDLGNNNLKDVFPYWLGNISTLRALILRSNKFYGSVGVLDGNQKKNYTFSTLNVLDISSNNFSGNLCAKCFSNFNSMMINTTDVRQSCTPTSFDFYYSLVVPPPIMNERQLMKKSIDISNNYFGGEILISIAQLVCLQVLDLSQNHMTGIITPQLGNLLQLESLDLSMNSLYGKIPQELVSLHFLSFLNLSYNELVGEIPSGGQFSTFPNTSFEGNVGLCRHPCNTSVPTVNNKAPPAPSMGGTTSENISYKIVLGLLFGVGLGGSMAVVTVVDVMCCDKSRRRRGIRPTHG